MYCPNCGTKIKDDAKFCKNCGVSIKGHRADNQKVDNYTKAVSLAKAGNNDGLVYLYEQTYKDKYYLALKYMDTKEAAEDVLQDAYIKAFSNIDRLVDPETFPIWFGTIVANTAKNALKKKNPVLFSEMETGDEDVDEQELQIPDEDMSTQPEVAYTRQETSEMVRDMIGCLSEEQKMCILMYYIDGENIKDIANAMGCSENTVKSRLNYGRKNLRAEADEMEKKGYKLYGLAPLPLLLMLMRMESGFLETSGELTTGMAAMGNAVLQASAKAAVESSANVASDVVIGTAEKAVGTAAAKSGSVAIAAAVGKTAAYKVVIGVIAAAVIGTGGIIGYQAYENNRAKENRQEEQENNPVSKQEVEEEIQGKDNSIAGEEEDAETAGEIRGANILTPEAAVEMSSKDIASVLGMEYIGNNLTISEKVITGISNGCIAAYVHDFDGDGENEILAVKVTTENNNDSVGIAMFETDGEYWNEVALVMEHFQSWSTLEGEYNDGISIDQEFYCHVKDNEIFISNECSVHDYWPITANVYTYDGVSFREGDPVSCTEQTIFNQGGFCLASARFSYSNTDYLSWLGWSHDFEESYIVNLIDYTDLSSHTVGDYEMSYPRYFDENDIKLVNGTRDNHEYVSFELGSGNNLWPSDYRDLSGEDFNVFYMYSGQYSDGEDESISIFWESGDNYWGFVEEDEYGEWLYTADRIDAFPLFHLSVCAHYDSYLIGGYIHSLSN